MGVHIKASRYRFAMPIKPNVVGAAALILMARDSLGRELTEPEAQRASGLSIPGWKDNKDAIMACIDTCFEMLDEKEQAA